MHSNISREDYIPILPGQFLTPLTCSTLIVVVICIGMFLGYVHPTGEIHIEDDNSWDVCSGMYRASDTSSIQFWTEFMSSSIIGQDNDSDLCTTGDVPTIFSGDESGYLCLYAVL